MCVCLCECEITQCEIKIGCISHWILLGDTHSLFRTQRVGEGANTGDTDEITAIHTSKTKKSTTTTITQQRNKKFTRNWKHTQNKRTKHKHQFIFINIPTSYMRTINREHFYERMRMKFTNILNHFLFIIRERKRKQYSALESKIEQLH